MAESKKEILSEVMEKLDTVGIDDLSELNGIVIKSAYLKGLVDGKKEAIAEKNWCEDCISFDYGKHWCSKWNGKTIADGTCHNWDGAKCNG